MKQVIIVGAGGHAAELRDYINHLNSVSDEQISVTGFLDDNEENYRHYDYHEPFLGTLQEHKVQDSTPYLMGIANIKYRRSIVERFLSEGGRFIGLIHPSALISPSAEIGEGVVISHNASVGPKVKLGNYNILNSRCTIGHDSVIGDYNFISPQVAVSGYTRIGDENMIGTNSCTIPGVSIGNKNIVAAGMVVYKSVGDEETVIFRHKERLVVRDPENNKHA